MPACELEGMSVWRVLRLIKVNGKERGVVSSVACFSRESKRFEIRLAGQH